MRTFKAKGKITLGKTRKTGRSLRKTRKAKTSNAVKQYVDKVISRKIETKMTDVENVGRIVYANISATDVYSLIPQLSQGTSEATRIGNKVNCVGLNLRMNLYCLNISNTTPPTYFDIYIFKMKNKQVSGGVPTSTDMAQFLEDGSSSKQYVGTSLDGMRYLNNDMFTICYRRRVLLYNPYSTGISSTASINPSKMFNINLTKYVKNSWLFNDGASSLVENDNLYLAIGATLTNGTTLPINTPFGFYDCLVQAKYKDA